MVGFLAEAVAAVNRKPHEFYELALQLVEKLPDRTGTDFVPLDVGSISMLALCAVQQAFRICRSAKRSWQERAAICAYVSGTFFQHPLCKPLYVQVCVRLRARAWFVCAR